MVAFAQPRVRVRQPDVQPGGSGCIVVVYPDGPASVLAPTFPSWEKAHEFAGKTGTGCVIFDAMTGVYEFKAV